MNVNQPIKFPNEPGSAGRVASPGTPRINEGIRFSPHPSNLTETSMTEGPKNEFEQLKERSRQNKNAYLYGQQ